MRTTLKNPGMATPPVAGEYTYPLSFCKSDPFGASRKAQAVDAAGISLAADRIRAAGPSSETTLVREQWAVPSVPVHGRTTAWIAPPSASTQQIQIGGGEAAADVCRRSGLAAQLRTCDTHAQHHPFAPGNGDWSRRPETQGAARRTAVAG